MSKLLSASHQGQTDDEIQAPNENPSSTSTSSYPALENSSGYSECWVPISEVPLLCDTPKTTSHNPAGVLWEERCGKITVCWFCFHLQIRKFNINVIKVPSELKGLCLYLLLGWTFILFVFNLLSHGVLRTLSVCPGCPKFHEMLLASSQGMYTVSLNTTYLDPVTS